MAIYNKTYSDNKGFIVYTNIGRLADMMYTDLASMTSEAFYESLFAIVEQLDAEELIVLRMALCGGLDACPSDRNVKADFYPIDHAARGCRPITITADDELVGF